MVARTPVWIQGSANPGLQFHREGRRGTPVAGTFTWDNHNVDGEIQLVWDGD